MADESWGEGMWSAADEQKLQEALARKAAAARAEVAQWDRVLFGELEWGYEQGFGRDELRQAMIDNASELIALLKDYTEADHG